MEGKDPSGLLVGYQSGGLQRRAGVANPDVKPGICGGEEAEALAVRRDFRARVLGIVEKLLEGDARRRRGGGGHEGGKQREKEREGETHLGT